MLKDKMQSTININSKKHKSLIVRYNLPCRKIVYLVRILDHHYMILEIE
jgi:hypothetical protein